MREQRGRGRAHLEVDRTGEEEDVKESGVGEVPEATDALERESLKLGVHSEAVPMQGSVPVDRKELHTTSGVPLLCCLACEPVGPQHQLGDLSEVIHCIGERVTLHLLHLIVKLYVHL